MKKVFVLVAVLSIMLFSAGLTFAASAQLDNLPGGAGVAYFQAGNGWTTLINIQHVGDWKNQPAFIIPGFVGNDACARVHIQIFDRNSAEVLNFTLPLTNLDNVGLVIGGGAGAGEILLTDYSDGAFGGNAVLNDFATGPAVSATLPAEADGTVVGYVGIVRTDFGCTAANAPTGNITGVWTLVPDSIYIRSALISATSAAAFNIPMLQGFVNIPAPVIEGVSTNNAGVCNGNGNAAFADTLAGTDLDDGNGAGIDFWELLITDPTTLLIECGGNVMINAMGAASDTPATRVYWARFNNDPAVGSTTQLSMVSPNYAPRGNFQRNNNLSILSYNDAETAVSFSTSAPEVAFIQFGSGLGAINVGTAVAGEARIEYNSPAFGFTATETASFADLYPLVRQRIALQAAGAFPVPTAFTPVFYAP